MESKLIDRFEREGYFSPVSVLSANQASGYRIKLEEYEKDLGHPVSGAERTKPHLYLKWVDELMRNPILLNCVEDIIGPNILCWNSWFWTKEANSASYVSWHQDSHYWGLNTDDLVTAWLALSPATEKSGCMRVLPKSHLNPLLEHQDLYHENNLLTRGQEILEVDEAKAVSMPLDPGEVSFHKIGLAHASTPNTTDDRRIGLSFHYIPTQTKQINVEWDTATLVRGEDLFHHFEESPVPRFDLDPESIAFHRKATDAMRELLFKDAEKVRETV